MQSPSHSTRSDVPRRESAGELLTKLYAGGGYERFVRLALSKLSDRRWESGEDAVQSASLSFLSAYDSRAGAIEDARAYFIVAVKHHAYKQNRTGARKPADLTDRVEVFGEAPAEDEVLVEVRDALKGVSEQPRQGLAMQILGFEREEIAGALGVSDRGLRKVIAQGPPGANRAAPLRRSGEISDTFWPHAPLIGRWTRSLQSRGPLRRPASTPGAVRRSANSPTETRAKRRGQLTARDLEIAAWLDRLTGASLQNIQTRFVLGQSQAYWRLQVLRDFGMVTAHRLLVELPTLFLPAGRTLRPASFEHSLRIATLIAAAEAQGRRTITEVELRRERAGEDGFPEWATDHDRAVALGCRRIPDAIEVTVSGGLRAIEIELSSKGSTRREQILGHYAASKYEQVIWLVPNDRLAALIEREVDRLGLARFMEVRNDW